MRIAVRDGYSFRLPVHSFVLKLLITPITEIKNRTPTIAVSAREGIGPPDGPVRYRWLKKDVFPHDFCDAEENREWQREGALRETHANTSQSAAWSFRRDTRATGVVSLRGARGRHERPCQFTVLQRARRAPIPVAPTASSKTVEGSGVGLGLSAGLTVTGPPVVISLPLHRAAEWASFTPPSAGLNANANK